MFSSYLKKIKKPMEKKASSALDIPYFFAQEDSKAGVESYKNNSIVHRCVSLIATSASHIPWHVYKNCGEHKKLLSKHPANKLLKTPCPDQSGADFFTENISSLLLYGKSFILATGQGQPAELHNLHPTMIDYVTSNQILVGYKYKTQNKEQIFPIDPINRMSHVLHLKNYNPSNSQQGLSALSAATKAIDLHAKIMDWNKSLLKNAIRPSGALVFQDGDGFLTDDQFERLQQQFYENFSGASNSGKPLILEGGLKWQETNNAERFEKFIELKDSSARDIAIAFNVPPQLLGLNGDNTYSNMQEARLALWEENIIPLLDKYSDALSGWLSHWYGEELLVDFDRESISVLTERRENLWSKISSANFMTINEKRSFVGLGPIENGGDLEGYDKG
ncbi:MAG: phage portal protein [Rickettsiaceae bacterium]|nr:phage portal protein [Rickettsiaceae bacterium]